jgi:hypothetical protein
MGLFQSLRKFVDPTAGGALNRVLGNTTIYNVASGKDTFSSAFRKDLNWFTGPSSMFGPSDEEKAATAAEEAAKAAQEEAAAAEEAQQFQDIKDLYTQGYESMGLTYTPGTDTQPQQGLYPQQSFSPQESLSPMSKPYQTGGLGASFNEIGLNKRNQFYPTNSKTGGGF